MHDDRESLAEKMNRGMFLDPGFALDRPSLADELRDEIDDTAEQSKAAHEAIVHPPDDADESDQSTE
jgi:hypothetical protein